MYYSIKLLKCQENGAGCAGKSEKTMDKPLILCYNRTRQRKRELPDPDLMKGRIV